MITDGAGIARGLVDVGVPGGLSGATCRIARRVARDLSRWCDDGIEVDELALVASIWFPVVYGLRSDAGRSVPVGSGFVHTDHLVEDERTFEELLERFGSDPERVASVAQECHLPVTPFRTTPPVAGVESSGTLRRSVGPPARVLSGLEVLDMTSMWAGPMCTKLLAGSGARVRRVESSTRADGLRGEPALFGHLHGDQTSIDLDLRRSDARAEFERLLAGADVLVESFTPRVLPNLGFGWDTIRSIAPDILVVSVRAFPAGSASANWSAYGGGVHATCGLGMRAKRPAPAAFSYLDPLTGLAAFGSIVAALGRRGRARRIEVSLATTAEGLRRDGVEAPDSTERPGPAVLAALRSRLDQGDDHPFRVGRVRS